MQIIGRGLKTLASSSFKQLVAPGIVAILIVIFDQATKLWAVGALQNSPPKEVLGQLLMFTLVYNDGGAMGTNFGSSTYYLISSILILSFLLYYLYKNRSNSHIVWPLSMIAAGAFGNIIDRIRLGRVIDFIDVDFFDINLFGYQLERWWTFNIADAAISCSIVYLLLIILFVRSLTYRQYQYRQLLRHADE